MSANYRLISHQNLSHRAIYLHDPRLPPTVSARRMEGDKVRGTAFASRLGPRHKPGGSACFVSLICTTGKSRKTARSSRCGFRPILSFIQAIVISA